MRHAVLLQLVLAGAVHQVVAVRRNGRAVREAPLGGLVLLVAQIVAGQGDGAVGIVLKLHPVHNLAVLVGDAHLGVGTYLVDDQRAAFHRVGRAVLDKAFFGIFITGAVVGGGFVMAHAVLIDARERIAGIRRQGRRGQLVNEVHVRVIEIEVVSCGRDLELAMERLGWIELIAVTGKHDHPLPRLERIAGEREGNAVGAIGDHHAFHVQIRAGTVVQFQPVVELTVFIRYGAVVGSHHLADDQAVKAAPADPSARLLGADEIDRDQQRRKQQQQRQHLLRLALALFGSVILARPRRAGRGGVGARGTALLLRRVVLHVRDRPPFLCRRWRAAARPRQGETGRGFG